MKNYQAFLHTAWLLCAGQLLAGACHAQATPDLATLQFRIQHRFERLDALKKDASFVQGIDRSLRRYEHDGAMTYDVLMVDSAAGRMAMKVYKPEHTEEELAMSLVLNEYLGELGMAPRIHGYLPHSELARILAGRLEGADSTALFSFGILMEVIEGAWNFKRDVYTYVPPQLKTWNGDAMVARLMLFQRTLNALRVKANDTQYFISASGQIYMADFDHFNWISPDNELWGYPAPFTIQEEEFARLKAIHGNTPIPVSNDEFAYDIEALRQVLAEHK